MTRLVLAVDLGSGGPKVGYVTTTGEPVWWWHERTDAVTGAEVQDAEEWWTTIVAAARRGIVEGGVDGAAVVGVAVTGQWASTVPVDASGRPVAECLMWSDTRGAEHSGAAFGGPVAGYSARALATWLRRSGGIPSPTGADPVAHMLHLDRDRPEVAAAARWYLEPVDYLTMRFTGVAAATLDVDDRRLADRQPRPRGAGLRPQPGPAGGGRTPTGCRRWSPAGRSSAPSCPRSRPPSASRPTPGW